MPIRISERVSAAVAALGPAGQRWLAGLPELVCGLEADWMGDLRDGA